MNAGKRRQSRSGGKRPEGAGTRRACCLLYGSDESRNSGLATADKKSDWRGSHLRLRSAAMLELLAAGAALAGRALLQAADTGLLAVGEDDLRAEEHHYPLRTRWLLALKREPESTARYTPPPPPLQEIEKILSEEARGGGPGAPSPELVHGLFSFAERTAKEIMVPRTRVVGVPIDATPQQAIDLLAEEGHTRMPVF